ncbi:MAG: hypothetical protein BroJett018_34170 [Chloroflexota bacterium]|nr:hypothetical protein [Chloroflexota bacterium]NOG64074.1 hypothetical protein [Chloroflexota bacterium]GIK65623.1 MAG: hypothetical protein BroJett018_34170 [Chloroflexota bacterium]
MNDFTDESRFPDIDPQLLPEDVLARFKKELLHPVSMIRGYSGMLLAQYQALDANLSQDEMIDTISRAADEILGLIKMVDRYLENRQYQNKS